MSNVAQSRDISDPKTVRDFADIVQSPERLKLLLLLTVADIRAVGPGVWNGWKGQLLRTLYQETEPLLSGGHTQIPRSTIVQEAQDALRAALSDWPAADVDHFIGRHYTDYWSTHRAEAPDRTRAPAAQSGSRRPHARSGSRNGRLHGRDRTDGLRAQPPATAVAVRGRLRRPTTPTLRARTSRRRATASHSTRSCWRANSSTTRMKLRRAKRIEDTIERLLRGDTWVEQLLEKRRPIATRAPKPSRSRPRSTSTTRCRMRTR